MAKLTPKPKGPAWVLVGALAAAAPIAVGCGDDDAPADSGAPDVGFDAGRDAGVLDAPGVDAGRPAPDVGVDAPQPDAGEADADDDAFVGI